MEANKLDKYSISDLVALNDKCLSEMGWRRMHRIEEKISANDEYWKYKKAMNIFSQEITRRSKEAILLIADDIEKYKLS